MISYNIINEEISNIKYLNKNEAHITYVLHFNNITII